MKRPRVPTFSEPQVFLILALLIGAASGLAVVCFRVAIEWSPTIQCGSGLWFRIP